MSRQLAVEEEAGTAEGLLRIGFLARAPPAQGEHFYPV
jgi:hypothetical protein